jgi:hypothetical protein
MEEKGHQETDFSTPLIFDEENLKGDLESTRLVMPSFCRNIY